MPEKSFNGNEENMEDTEKEFFEKIKEWTDKKTDGDREELSLTYKERFLWQKVAASSEDCFGPACHKYKEITSNRKIEKSSEGIKLLLKALNLK